MILPFALLKRQTALIFKLNIQTVQLLVAAAFFCKKAAAFAIAPHRMTKVLRFLHKLNIYYIFPSLTVHIL